MTFSTFYWSRKNFNQLHMEKLGASFTNVFLMKNRVFTPSIVHNNDW